jgi:hypothetical protein
MTAITKAALRAVGIINPYGVAAVAGKASVFVVYYPYERTSSSGWIVQRADSVGTDPASKSPTNIRGDKVFNPSFYPGTNAAAKVVALGDAQAWAAKRFGIVGEWWRDPFGGWHPVSTRTAIEALLKASS